MAAPSPERVSVIVRARDEAPSIGRALALLREQRTGEGKLELIVVDSGSRDRTVQIAREHGARVIAMPAHEFSFGGALNLGCAEASGDVLVALSAHAFAPDRDWLARLLAPFSDERVACASGESHGPDARPLEGQVVQDEALAARHPTWGYSNGAGAFRADLWRERPFRVDLPGCEDKEWARHWLARGRVAILCPSLLTDHNHAHDPLVASYVRARREWEGYAMFLELPPCDARRALRTWWTDRERYRSATRARLSPRRLARLAGQLRGRQRGARRRLAD